MTKRHLPFYGHSASKLDLAERCGHAGTIKTASGPAAAVSKYAHAMAEGDRDKAAELFAGLSPEQQREAVAFRIPRSFEVLGEQVDWSMAQTEVRWALDASGCPVDYESPDRITRGIADFVVALEPTEHRGACLVIGDHKLSRHTTAAGTDTLQLHAAGIALAQQEGCISYLPVLWHLDEGSLAVGQKVRLDSREATYYWDRVSFAARNQSGPTTGEHCARCYGRWQCIAYTTPAHTQESWLAPLAGDSVVLTDEKATELALMLPAVEEAVRRAKEHLQAYVTQGGNIEADGKRYAPVQTKGRTKLDQKAVAKALGVADLSDFETRGADYVTWRWVKVKK